jgi:hypothetical protein
VPGGGGQSYAGHAWTVLDLKRTTRMRRSDQKTRPSSLASMKEEACIIVVTSGGGRGRRGSGSVKVEESVPGLLGLVYTAQSIAEEKGEKAN